MELVSYWDMFEHGSAFSTELAASTGQEIVGLLTLSNQTIGFREFLGIALAPTMSPNENNAIHCEPRAGNLEPPFTFCSPARGIIGSSSPLTIFVFFIEMG